MALFVAHSISRKRILGKRRLRLLRASVLRQFVSMTTAVTPDAPTQWQSRGRQGRQSICRSGQRHLLVPLICHCAFPPGKEDIGVSPETVFDSCQRYLEASTSHPLGKSGSLAIHSFSIGLFKLRISNVLIPHTPPPSLTFHP